MEKRYYTPQQLAGELADFERRFGVSSEAFVEAYERGESTVAISHFDAFTWATTYGELRLIRSLRVPRPVG